MKTRLYNTDTEQFISKTFDGGYKVDGQKPVLPDHIVELEIVTNPALTSNPETHRLERVTEIDIDTKQYITTWQEIELTDYEKAIRDWEGGDLELKIVAPIHLILDDFGVKMKGWFELNGLPIISKGEFVHLYCNQILPEFEETVNALVDAGTIQIIERPKPEDFE